MLWLCWPSISSGIKPAKNLTLNSNPKSLPKQNCGRPNLTTVYHEYGTVNKSEWWHWYVTHLRCTDCVPVAAATPASLWSSVETAAAGCGLSAENSAPDEK